MKQINYICLMALAALLAGACAEKKKSNTIIVPKPAPKVVKATQKMSNYEQAREVSWLGAKYKVVVKRTADAQLPVLCLDDSTRYYDNRITVTILRGDGSEFFSRSFSKENFAEHLDEKTRDKGALLGIIYVSAAGNRLEFAASVGSPDVTSDEYVPLLLRISNMGHVTISSDETLDTGGEENKKMDDDEGV